MTAQNSARSASTAPKVPIKSWRDLGLLDPLPDYLLPYVYEVVDGKPIFRKGYREALLNSPHQTNQERGSSNLQALIVSKILRLLFGVLPEQNYVISTGEHGINLEKHNNRSLDIAVFQQGVLRVDKHYAKVPPLVAIEIDVDADLDTYGETELKYHKTKTRDLLDFGTGRVVWIFTASKSVIVATADRPWQIYDAADEVKIIDDCSFRLKTILDDLAPSA